MAYAALLSLTRTLDNIVISRDESLILDKELQIKSLHQKLGLFISFLEETSQNNSDSIEDLEERIRDVVYEAEDIIESHMSKQILSKADSRNSEENYEDDLEKQKYEEGLKNIVEKLDFFWGEVEKVKNKNNIKGLEIENTLPGPVKVESSSEIEEVEKMHPEKASSSKSPSKSTSAPMVGFEADMSQIKELLASSSTQLEAISIVGMGGIGKTTLARSIYNDSFVNRHFDIRAWTTISKKYNVVAILGDLFKSMGHPTNGMDMEELKLKVYQNLKQRRYLIIMDDVWDIDFLEEFKKIFPDDDIGSRIIMTSRSSKVANVEYYSGHLHRMNFLSPEQSWDLLRQKALGEETCPPKLEEIGWKIAEKCKGLPLALAVVGGVLFKAKKTRAHWKYIEENMKSAEAGNYDDLMEVLSWSYNHLPHHLKACFLYTAVFPEDYVIHISHLIRLWLAEGFIRPFPPRSLEHVANEYLEDLVARNLVMVHDRNYYGEIRTCTVHDLMRDLCMRKAREKMYLHVLDNSDEEAIKNQRFLSFQSKDLFEHRYDSNVRSLLHFRRHQYELPKDIPLKLLRVLDACNLTFDKFPTQVTKLVNLRYLALSYKGKGKVPASISKLRYLQTLIVLKYNWTLYPYPILYLPPEILRMPWLRHVLVDGSSFLSYPPGEPNWNLQVLSGLINFKFTKDAIENILDLKTLGILYCHDQGTIWSIYRLANLVHLRQLENLKIHFFAALSYADPWCRLPLNLRFPEKLKKLTLDGCMVSSKHSSVIGTLSNLQVLKLKNVHFKKCVWRTNEGEFTKLKFLLIQSDLLKRWEAEETHFPSLECLSLRECLELKCIPCGIGKIPSLRDIVLDSCSSGVVDSAYEILNEQRDFGNESLQLHVDSLEEDGVRSGIRIQDYY